MPSKFARGRADLLVGNSKSPRHQYPAFNGAEAAAPPHPVQLLGAIGPNVGEVHPTHLFHPEDALDELPYAADTDRLPSFGLVLGSVDDVSVNVAGALGMGSVALGR